MALNNVTNPNEYFDLDRNIKIQPVTGNYKDLYQFADQYYPSLKQDLINQYGNQTVRGMLDKLAQREGISADTQYFGLEGRRRNRMDGVTRAGDVFTKAAHTIRPNEVFIVTDVTGDKTDIGICLPDSYDAGKFTAKPYNATDWTVGTSNLIIIAAGTEFQKGSLGMTRALTREIQIDSTSLIISKDMYEINGSDACNITWLKSPDGNAFWMSEEVEEAKQRMLDWMEMQAFIGVKAVDGSGAKTAGFRGIEGIFDKIRKGGNSMEGTISGLTDVESIIKRLDMVNGEKYNVLYLDTETSLSIDKWLGSVGGAYSASWGYFENKDDMIKFGFDAFKMGGYEFYKTTWKMLKDPTALNPMNFAPSKQVHGIMIPMGNTVIQTGYNGDLSGETWSQNAPYITKLYKEMPGYSRELVTHFHGSQMVPDSTDTTDVFGINWLSEWGIRAIGMKKWLILEGTTA